MAVTLDATNDLTVSRIPGDLTQCFGDFLNSPSDPFTADSFLSPSPHGSWYAVLVCDPSHLPATVSTGWVQAGTTQTHGDQSVQVYYNTTGANKTLTFTGLSGAISFFQFEIIHGGIPAGFASRVDTSGGYNIVTPQIQVPYGSWAFAVMTCDDSSYAPGPIGWTWYLNNATSGKNALLAAKSCAKATTAVCARTVPSGGAGVTNNNGTIFYVPAVG